MKYEFNWSEMTSREKQLWNQLIAEREVNVDVQATFKPQYQFNFKITGKESIRFLRLAEKLRENFPLIDIKNQKEWASLEEKGDPTVQLAKMTHEPLVVVYYCNDHFTVFCKDIPSAQPIIDLIYNADLNVTGSNLRGDTVVEMGRNVLKHHMEEISKISASWQEEDRLRS